MSSSVAVIGAGLIGRAWAIVFARAGFDVALQDVSPDALETAGTAIEAALEDLATFGLVTDTASVRRRIRREPTLSGALEGVEYVQECGPETLAAKRELFAALDRLAPEEAVLASSTSGIVASAFTAGLARPERVLVAHPVNPPYLIPLVELSPSPQTSEEVVARARKLLSAAGQVPVTVRGELSGFVLNRLQGAVLNEALRLVEGGHVSVEDLDRTVRHGLGLRWSFMGPFETIDLNAPGGIADYARRYGPLYQGMADAQATPPEWSDAAIGRLERDRREQLPEVRLGERQRWRDKRLMALVAHQLRMQKSVET